MYMYNVHVCVGVLYVCVCLCVCIISVISAYMYRVYSCVTFLPDTLVLTEWSGNLCSFGVGAVHSFYRWGL